MLVSPSLLAADFTNLEKEIKRLNENKVDLIHLDVMDGNFVPNISFGPGIIKQLRPLTKIPFDVHLMITNPDQYIDVFKESGADFLTYHIETNVNHFQMIKSIKEKGMKVGLSIKPKTPIEEIIPYLKYLDLVLVMSVEPGFGGQTFMRSSLSKIEFLNQYKKINNLDYLIEVDGGINDKTAKQVKEVGCDVVVAGTYAFKGDMTLNVMKLR